MSLHLPPRLRRLVEGLRRLLARIGVRLLLFNLLLVFLPAAGILVLDTYERQLLAAQERSMVQQGRLLAAALSGQPDLDGVRARRILVELARRHDARLRVVDADAMVVADSSRLGPRADEVAAEGDGADDGGADDGGPDASIREQPLYRLGSFLHGLWRSLLGGDGEPTSPAEPGYPGDPELPARALYGGDGPLAGSAVREALAGRYGADLQAAPAGRSVLLHSAIPVLGSPARLSRDLPPDLSLDLPADETGAGAAGEGLPLATGPVVGAVLVSQSTSRVLTALWRVRLAIFRVIVASVVAAVVLSLFLAATLVRPLGRLRNQAAALLDRRGRLRGRFSGTRRRDEIGDLARALARLTERLTDYQRIRESFAADVSHELRNPLASLRTATELLAEAHDPAERRRFAAMALGDVARLEHLLAAVGEIGRIDAELEDDAAEPVALGLLAAALVEGFRLRHPRGPRLEAVLPQAAVGVEASPDRLAQVVENLLDNAVSFTPPEGTVTVTVRAVTDAAGRELARLTVEDTGPGIPERHLPRLFERFFSYRPEDPEDGAAADGHRLVHHSGLGLAIARAIVERYGGTLTAENVTAENLAAAPEAETGARFVLTLPRIPLAPGTEA